MQDTLENAVFVRGGLSRKQWHTGGRNSATQNVVAVWFVLCSSLQQFQRTINWTLAGRNVFLPVASRSILTASATATA